MGTTIVNMIYINFFLVFIVWLLKFKDETTCDSYRYKFFEIRDKLRSLEIENNEYQYNQAFKFLDWLINDIIKNIEHYDTRWIYDVVSHAEKINEHNRKNAEIMRQELKKDSQLENILQEVLNNINSLLIHNSFILKFVLFCFIVKNFPQLITEKLRSLLNPENFKRLLATGGVTAILSGINIMPCSVQKPDSIMARINKVHSVSAYNKTTHLRQSFARS